MNLVIPKEVSTALQALGVVEFAQGNYGRARATLEESLSISRKVNNKSAMPRVLMHLGALLREWKEIMMPPRSTFMRVWRSAGRYKMII